MLLLVALSLLRASPVDTCADVTFLYSKSGNLPDTEIDAMVWRVRADPAEKTWLGRETQVINAINWKFTDEDEDEDPFHITGLRGGQRNYLGAINMLLENKGLNKEVDCVFIAGELGESDANKKWLELEEAIKKNEPRVDSMEMAWYNHAGGKCKVYRINDKKGVMSSDCEENAVKDVEERFREFLGETEPSCDSVAVAISAYDGYQFKKEIKDIKDKIIRQTWDSDMLLYAYEEHDFGKSATTWTLESPAYMALKGEKWIKEYKPTESVSRLTLGNMADAINLFYGEIGKELQPLAKDSSQPLTIDCLFIVGEMQGKGQDGSAAINARAQSPLNTTVNHVEYVWYKTKGKTCKTYASPNLTIEEECIMDKVDTDIVEKYIEFLEDPQPVEKGEPIFPVKKAVEKKTDSGASSSAATIATVMALAAVGRILGEM